jgi:DNA-binding NarL/FixJ family response regulator
MDSPRRDHVGIGPRRPRRAIRVLIASDVRLCREGLAAMLRNEDGVAFVGGTSGCDETVAAARRLRPDVVLLNLPIGDAIATANALAKSLPSVRVVAWGGSDDTAVLIGIAAGLSAYVARDAALEDLMRTVEYVCHGAQDSFSSVAATVFPRAPEGSQGDAHVELTVRECEVLRLIAEGRSNKEIARSLVVDLQTAKNHVHNILKKLGVHRRSDAVAQAERQGILLRARVDHL